MTKRTFTQQPTPMGQLVDQVMIAAVTAPLAPIARGSAEARYRQRVQEQVERIVQKALWRAERRSRRVPRRVRQSSPWVMGQRRRIAYELAGALHRFGFGQAVSNQIAEDACERFPRDGVVIVIDRPRARGEAPRQVGTNPRARATSPRQLGESPRQKRNRGEGFAHPPVTPS
jgi:hypothetical protein